MTTYSSVRRLLSEFPSLVPCDSSLSAYAGFVKFGNNEYRVRIAADCSYFDADDELTAILAPKMSTLYQRLGTTTTAYNFLFEVRDVVEQELGQEAVDGRSQKLAVDCILPPAAYYDRLLQHISSIGWEHVSALDQSMRTIDLVVVDIASRSHTLNLSLSPDFPSARPICVVDLPGDFQPSWDKGEQTLSSLLNQFRKTIEKYQDLFRAMDDFDHHTRVLEPERPTRRDSYRRIALGKHTSIRINLETVSPLTTYPECRFLGSEAAVAPLRQRLNENMHHWDNSGNVLPRNNLESILNIELPEALNSVTLAKLTAEGELEDECGICYTYRLDDGVPEVACDKPECGKAYHRQCLFEWLRALPDTRESFGTLSGNCVYCEEPISVTIATS